jgi:hypothetical protein
MGGQLPAPEQPMLSIVTGASSRIESINVQCITYKLNSWRKLDFTLSLASDSACFERQVAF